MAIPDRIGRYRILGPLGSGGMGTVFKALDDEGQEVVALKLLAHDAAVLGPEGLERFRREATALSRLPHPNIVGVRDAGQADGVSYLALELVEGGPVSARPYAEMTLVRKLEIGQGVARALAHAHAHGVVHRDVKPANILLRPDGAAVLTDFGLARDVSRQTKLTQSIALMGTPAYMSPEQAEGITRAVDARSDVYSLGVVLYEMIAGRLPFPDADAESLLARIRNERPPRLGTLVPGLPEAVVAIVEKAMERRPEDRYADGKALLEDVERHLAGEKPRARVIGAWDAALREVRRRPGTVMAAGAALLLLGLASFCGSPARLEPARTWSKVTAALDGVYDAETRPLAAEADRLDAPRITAALEEYSHAASGGSTLALVQDVETEIGASRVDAKVVVVIDRDGVYVTSTGDRDVATALYEAFSENRTARRLLTVSSGAIWIGAATELHEPGGRAVGWAIAARPLDQDRVHGAVSTYDATVLWEGNGQAYLLYAGSRRGTADDGLSAFRQELGSRAVPGVKESVRARDAMQSPARVAGLGVALLGMVVLVAGGWCREARRG